MPFLAFAAAMAGAVVWMAVPPGQAAGAPEHAAPTAAPAPPLHAPQVPSVPPPRKTPPQNLAGSGTLCVRSTPEPAEVYLDGAYQGLTPRTISGLTSGEHSLKVARDGFTPYVSFGPLAGTEIDAQLEMEPTGAIQVRSKPGGARVLVDGLPRGSTPTEVKGLTAGTHPVTISLTNHETWRGSATVQPGATVVVEMELEDRQLKMLEAATWRAGSQVQACADLALYLLDTGRPERAAAAYGRGVRAGLTTRDQAERQALEQRLIQGGLFSTQVDVPAETRGRFNRACIPMTLDLLSEFPYEATINKISMRFLHINPYQENLIDLAQNFISSPEYKNDPGLWMRLGGLALSRGAFDRGDGFIRNGLDMARQQPAAETPGVKWEGPDSFPVQFLAGSAYLRGMKQGAETEKKALEAAYRHLRAAADKAPPAGDDAVQCLRSLTIAAWNLDRKDEALTWAHAAIARTTASAEREMLLFRMAGLLQKAGQWSEAVRTYQDLVNEGTEYAQQSKTMLDQLLKEHPEIKDAQ
jgi:tetratricopeptide (TPR) repeat protein